MVKGRAGRSLALPVRAGRNENESSAARAGMASRWPRMSARGCVEVSGANSFAGGGAGFHFAGPADEEGGAVPALKNIGLVAAPVGVGLVALGD